MPSPRRPAGLAQVVDKRRIQIKNAQKRLFVPFCEAAGAKKEGKASRNSVLRNIFSRKSASQRLPKKKRICSKSADRCATSPPYRGISPPAEGIFCEAKSETTVGAIVRHLWRLATQRPTALDPWALFAKQKIRTTAGAVVCGIRRLKRFAERETCAARGSKLSSNGRKPLLWSTV